jgi:hypothetical protein
MGTTPILALPYPEASDPADVPTDIHELATALDGLVHKVSYGTTPPASPNDGDEWILPADSTSGVMWRFRYRAASASASKWEFVGGPPLYRSVDTAEGTASTTAADLPTVGPQFTIPRAGDYLIDTVANMTNTAAAFTIVCIKVGALVATDQQAMSAAANTYVEASTTALLTAAASDVVKMQYRVTTGTGTFSRRRMQITPVRVT